MVQQFKETRHLISTGISALKRGVLKRRQNKSTIHFNRESTNTELCFTRFILQLSSVSTEQRRTGVLSSAWRMKRKDQNAVPMKSKVLIVVEPEEVEWFTANSSTWKQGAGTQQFVFWRTEVKWHSCVKRLPSSIWFLLEILPDTTWWKRWMGENTFLCCEYTISRAFKESEVRLAILAGTMIGPISEVHIVATLGEYCIEIGVLFFFYSKSIGHIFRCDIPRDWKLRERASSTQKRVQVQWWIAQRRV